MLGLGNDDDSERFWNLILFKVYATDKEIEEMFPFFIGGVILLAIVVGIVYYFCH